MKNFKKWLILPLIVMLFVPVMILSACGKGDNGDANDKFYGITISGELPQGVMSIIPDNNNVREGEDLNFYIELQKLYTIGTLKVLCNGIEVVSFKSENTSNGNRYFYCISNISEDVVITFTGATEEAEYEISGIWVDNSGVAKTDDKDINNFFVDMYIASGSEDSSMSSYFNFSSMTDFKQYIKSKTFDRSVCYNDVISLWVYSKDNCESFVDGWIYCNNSAIIPETEVKTENIEGTEVRYLKAKYNLYITDNTEIYFYEEAVVRSVEIPVSICVIDGIETKNYSSPRIVFKNEEGLTIGDYVELKKAETINVYIENVSDVWKPIFDNPNLEYSLSLGNDKFVFEEGEFVSDRGNYIFKNVSLPYDRGTFANYTLYITNAKDLILADNNYSKISVIKENIIGYNLSENEFINIKSEGKYYYSKCANNMFVNIKNNFTKIKIELSNDAGETKTVTLALTSKKQDITDGYTFSRYRLENNYNVYQISYNGTGTFYNNIKLTALEN